MRGAVVRGAVVSKKPIKAPKGKALSTVKGFSRDWTCRGFQFEIGKTYTHDGAVEACESGFHACAYPLDVFCYYAPGESRYAEVTQAGALSRHDSDSKIASARITIDAEIGIPKIVERAIAWVLKQTTPAGGNHSDGDQSASSSTGYQSASSSTGDRSASSVHGEKSCAMAAGDGGSVMAERDGCALFLVYRDPSTGGILHAWAGITGRAGVRAGVWYSLGPDGLPVEVTR